MKKLIDIANKIANKEEITDFERLVIVGAIGYQSKAMEYYSQSFAGTWDNDKVNLSVYVTPK